MDETQIVGVTFEPDWYAVYVDGELSGEGHGQRGIDLIISAVNRSENPCHIEATDTPVDGPWAETPDTLTELVKKEQFDVSESVLD